MSEQKCIACGGPLTLFGPRLKYEYHQCKNCKTIQLNPMPSPEELNRAYAEDYATAGHFDGDPETCNRSAETYYNNVIKALKDYKAEGLILDYGSGWGGLSELLQKNGFKIAGVEPSDEMAAYCQKKGLPVKHGNLKTIQDLKGQVGAMALTTVFEHLAGIDEFLKDARELIKKEGLFVTLHPTATFAGFFGKLIRFGNLKKPLPSVHTIFEPPWHTNLISLKGMEILMNKHGFELLEIRPAPQSRATNWTKYVQITLENVNKIGWAIFGKSWPLVIAHTFVFRKK